MIEIQSAVYSARNKAERYVGIINQKQFFVIIEVGEGVEFETGEKITHAVQSDLTLTDFPKLSDFESFFIEQYKKHGLPVGSSLAAGYLKGSVLYIKTMGSGLIYIDRTSRFIKLLSGDKCASGYVRGKDILVFTTKQLFSVVKTESNLRNIINHRATGEIDRSMSDTIEESNDAGVGLIAVSFVLPSRPETAFLVGIFLDLQEKSRVAGRKKTVTTIFIIIIAIILLWSVGLGQERRKKAEVAKKVHAARELIVAKLSQAGEVSFLNMPRALILVSEAKGVMAKLKKEIGTGDKAEVALLWTLISDKEGSIIKKEVKNYEEFYDLALDQKSAYGSQLAFDTDSVAIFDKKNSNVYILSLAKKSLVKREGRAVAASDAIGFFHDDVFLMSQKNGIYKFVDRGFKKVIEPDKDWGKLAALQIYNGNLYIADSAKNDVYKYIGTDSEYSKKSSYFGAGEAPDLTNVNSVAIDSSLYLGLESKVLKFTGGVRDSFGTSYPEGSVNVTKIFTTKDDDSVYVWDKSRKSIFILSKKGEYERQINSGILGVIADFAIYNNKVYLLMGSKIYIIAL